MNSLAKVIIMGTLAEDPVIRNMEDGRKMVGLSAFTLRAKHHDESRELPEEVEWHRVVITNQRLAAYAETNLAEDDQIYLEGELHTSFWQNETYELQSLTEILLEHEGDKLMRLSPGCDEPATRLNIPAIAGNHGFGGSCFDHEKLGCVA